MHEQLGIRLMIERHPALPPHALDPEQLEADERLLPTLGERQRAWLRSGDLRVLWPELDPSAVQRAADEVGRAVAALLRDERPSLGRADGSDARALGVAGLLTGVGPLLGYWIEAGSLDASEPVARALALHLAHGRRRVERIRDEVLPVLGRMSDAGVAPAVMKGFHTAYSYFPDPGTRPLGDVDVVVAPSDIPRAEAELAAAGFTGASVTRRPYKRDWTPANIDDRVWSFELWHVRSPWKIELHDGLNFDHLARDSRVLSQESVFGGVWSALGVRLRVPTQPSLVAMLAIHASGELYQSRLLRLVELIFVVRQNQRRGVGEGQLEWAGVEELLARTDTLRFTYPAFALAERLAPGTIDAGLLERSRRACTGRVRTVTDRFTPTAKVLPETFRFTERFMWSSGWRATLSRIVRLIVPPQLSPREILRLYHDRLRRLARNFAPRWFHGGRPPDTPSS
jgi:hypothetical protein